MTAFYLFYPQVEIEKDVKADLSLKKRAIGPFPGSPYSQAEEAKIAHNFQIDIESEIEKDVESDLSKRSAGPKEPLPGSPFSQAEEAAIEDALQAEVIADAERVIEKDLGRRRRAIGPFPGSPYTEAEEAKIAAGFKSDIENEIEQDVEFKIFADEDAERRKRSLAHKPFPGSPYTAAEEDAFGSAVEKELEVCTLLK